MRYISIRYRCSFFLVGLFIVTSALQNDRLFLTVFFVNQFNNDSVEVLLNNKEKIFSENLLTEFSTGQCDKFFPVMLTDSIQRLAFTQIKSKARFDTEIKKGFRYLYVFKLGNGSFRFDYSNKLSLPE